MSAQSTLGDFATGEDRFSCLTEAEREAYEKVEEGHWGGREFARHTDRSPGTLSNLLRRARQKLEDSPEEGSADA